MDQTVINLETKKEYLYMELKNDVTSVSLNIKKSKAQKDFPLLLILFMNIKLKIKATIIYLSSNTNQYLKKISL